MSFLKAAAACAAFGLLQACASQGSAAGSGKPSSEADAAVANMNLGAGYLRQGRPELAIERLLRALRQDPRLVLAHSTIALAYDQLGSFEDAEEHYRRATQLEPGNSEAANAYAVFLCNRQKRWSDAEPYFKRAVDNPRYTTPAVALTNAGVCALDAGDRAKAEENFRAALTKDPMSAAALSNMLEMSYQDKNYLQARAFLQRYMAARPATAPILWMCFNIEQQLENRDAANRCASQLREGFPGSPEVAELRELQQSNGR
jgi:type IV pilus assembly protein PilF